MSQWWCGQVVKAQCFESCGVYLGWIEILLLTQQTTSQQPTQLSILPRLVNTYSEATLRPQAVALQAHISCIAVRILSLR